MKLSVSHAQIVGPRVEQQDCLLSAPKQGTFVVCDGMGGHEGGALAAKLAIQTLAGAYSPASKAPVGEQLQFAVMQANEHILQEQKRTAALATMGTTLVALVFDPARPVAALVWAGDSRAYRLRAGVLEPLTTDHSLLQRYRVANPTLSVSEIDALYIRQHRDAGSNHSDAELLGDLHNTITRVLGSGKEAGELRHVDVQEGDVFLLCSDGLHSYYSDEGIKSVLASKVADPAGSLVKRAQRVTRDNTTCIIVCVEPTTAPARRRAR